MAETLRLVLVTPERRLLDEPIDGLRVPLFDGSLGMLPGRAPLVGRLGIGELRITRGGNNVSYFIEGGFVQVKGPIVSVLTQKAVPAASIDAANISAKLEETLKLAPTTDADFANKALNQERFRKMLAVKNAGG